MRSARRFNKPRKVGADSEDEESTAPAAIVKKKNKKPTSSTAATTNLSFTDPPDATEKPFSVKKSALSRKALERAAAARSLPEDNGGGVDAQEEKGTLYSKEYLEELRSETPSTPTPFQTAEGEGDGDVAMCEAGAVGGGGDPLGTFSKFGTTAAAAAKLPTDLGGTAIPDPALVKVLKARRAAEATKSTSTEYISLSPTHSSASEDDNGRVRRKKPSRLVRTEILDEDDEQLATFIHDPSTSTSAAHPSRLILTSALSSRAGALQEEKYLRRGQIQEALLGISSSESSSDDSSHADDDDDDGNGHAPDWHRRQLRIATGLSSLDGKDDPTSSLDARLRYQPPAIPPVPELDGKLKWLQEVLAEMVRARDGLVCRVEEVKREKEEIRRRETEVQEGLGRLSEQYSRLGIAEKDPGGEGVEGMGRGLESLGVQ